MATTPEATVYNVADGRGYDQACDLIADDYDGVIVRDGRASYRCYTDATHQSVRRPPAAPLPQTDRLSLPA